MKISGMAPRSSFSGKVLLDSKFVSVDRGAPCFKPAMADVFISYAKADRPLALKLAAMLEAEGWKVWWDTSLTIGDDFRNEIMTELGRARAVIVIWTDASIKSDWVRSEAGRAQADRKLIPVKLEHLRIRTCRHRLVFCTPRTLARMTRELCAEVGDGLTGRRRRIVGVFAPPLLQQRSDTPCPMLPWSSWFNQGRSLTRSPRCCATGRAPCWRKRWRPRWPTSLPSMSM